MYYNTDDREGKDLREGGGRGGEDRVAKQNAGACGVGPNRTILAMDRDSAGGSVARRHITANQNEINYRDRVK